ncbi:MAG: hypothetical protein NTW35_03150 [Candidatus Nomurabacteria bacterium]|nr:hypothetical protein [Candidatus Nomurabacteria bacterium]
MIIKTIKSITFWMAAIVAIIVIAGVYRFNFTNGGDVINTLRDVKNLTYIVENETFNLVNGVANNETIKESKTKNTLSIFGEPIYGDLNGDGVGNDAAIILVNNPGGSGTFYYAVLAINTNGEYKTTNALLLGDRIAPQTVEIPDGVALFNYAERNAGEPMTTQPSNGKSLWINYDANSGKISELVKPQSD